MPLGLSLRVVTHITPVTAKYASHAHCWNNSPHKTTSLLWVWRSSQQVPQTVMTALKQKQATHQDKLFLLFTINSNKGGLSLNCSLTEDLVIFSHTHNSMLFKESTICISPIFILRCQRNWCSPWLLELLAVHPLIFEVGKVYAVSIYKECTSSILMDKCATAEVLRGKGQEASLSLTPTAHNISSIFLRSHLRPENFIWQKKIQFILRSLHITTWHHFWYPWVEIRAFIFVVAVVATTFKYSHCHRIWLHKR